MGTNIQMLALTGTRDSLEGISLDYKQKATYFIFLMVSLSCTSVCSAAVTFWCVTGMHNHIHMGAGPPPQFNRMEEMVQKGKRGRWRREREMCVIAFEITFPINYLCFI